MNIFTIVFTLIVVNLNLTEGGIVRPLTQGYRECGTEKSICTTCTKNETPCRFEKHEKQNKDSYYGCIEMGKEFYCCPVGYTYNNNTRDVTCIGYNEELIGYGAHKMRANDTDWKFCNDQDYPSCKLKTGLIDGNREKYNHTCIHISKPCNGICSPGYRLDTKKEVCGKINKFVPSINFQACSTYKQSSCFCTDNQQPCRFNGYPGQTYQGCITKGYEKHCCPKGWKYNPNSMDVTCIGESEELLNGKETEDWKWCPDNQYPSCRIKLKSDERSSSFYKHICRTPNNGCLTDQLYVGGIINSDCTLLAEPFYSAYCLRTDTCLKIDLGTGNGWQICSNNKNSDGPSLDAENGKPMNEAKIVKNNHNQNKDDVPMTTINIAVSTSAGIVLLAILLTAGIVCYKRNKLNRIEMVDDNPDYGYGEVEDNIVIIDFNPIYGENDEDGRADIVDYNPLYGVGEDEEDGKADIVDYNPLYGVGEGED